MLQVTRNAGKAGLWTYGLEAWTLDTWTVGLWTPGRLDNRLTSSTGVVFLLKNLTVSHNYGLAIKVDSKPGRTVLIVNRLFWC